MRRCVKNVLTHQFVGEDKSWESEVRSGEGCSEKCFNEMKIVLLKNISLGFKFEKLIIRQNAMEFGESINKLSLKFPQYEMYNLSSQIRRSVDSIALNISRGQLDNLTPNLRSLWDILFVH